MSVMYKKEDILATLNATKERITANEAEEMQSYEDQREKYVSQTQSNILASSRAAAQLLEDTDDFPKDGTLDEQVAWAVRRNEIAAKITSISKPSSAGYVNGRYKSWAEIRKMFAAQHAEVDAKISLITNASMEKDDIGFSVTALKDLGLLPFIRGERYR